MAARDDNLATVYAGALLELAFEKGVHAEVLAELRALGEILRQVPRFVTFLNTPNIGREVKKDLVDRVLGGQFSDATQNFLRVVIDKRRQAHLGAMIVAFEDGYHARMGEVVVLVTSAAALVDAQRKRLAAALKRRLDKEIILDERVDPRLLGGMVLRVGDSRIDGSLRSRLESIGARLTAARFRSEDYYEDQG